MPAAYITRYAKTALSVADRPCPTAADLGSQQVLVRVHVVALNPADIKMRSGAIKVFGKAPSTTNPVTLGCDCAGEIIALGPNVSTEWKVGDRVLCVSTDGALAHFTRVHQENMAQIPTNIGYGQAASIVTAGMTAIQMLQLAGAEDGQLDKILVTAGAGGVGHLAIQLAKRVFKIKTVATTASGAKHAFVRECGADIAIDYTVKGPDGDFVKVLGGGYDAALDCTGETAKCKKIVRPGGMVVGILGVPDGKMLTQVTQLYHMSPLPCFVPPLLNCITCCATCCSRVRVKNIIMLPYGKQIAQVAQWCADGTIKPTIDRIYSLEQSVQAFDYVEEGRVIGKVLVEVVPGAAADVQQIRPL